MRDYSSLKKLRSGQDLFLPKEGVTVRLDTGEIQPGDFYVAERNTGPHLLTAARIDREHLHVIFPKENEYPFYIGECVKVEVIFP